MAQVFVITWGQYHGYEKSWTTHGFQAEARIVKDVATVWHMGKVIGESTLHVTRDTVRTERTASRPTDRLLKGQPVLEGVLSLPTLPDRVGS